MGHFEVLVASYYVPIACSSGFVEQHSPVTPAFAGEVSDTRVVAFAMTCLLEVEVQVVVVVAAAVEMADFAVVVEAGSAAAAPVSWTESMRK